MEYFTADWHINHKKIIKYCNRPFENVDQMDDTIIVNATARLRKGDILYFLGDLSFSKGKADGFFNIMRFIGVQVHYIFGNHDYNIRNIIKDRAAWSGEQKSIKIQGQDIFLNHFSMRVWHKSHFNSWHFYGHSHGKLPEWGKSWDVGVDNNDFQILSFDEVKAIMDICPDNFNFIKEGERR